MKKEKIFLAKRKAESLHNQVIGEEATAQEKVKKKHRRNDEDLDFSKQAGKVIRWYTRRERARSLE